MLQPAVILIAFPRTMRIDLWENYARLPSLSRGVSRLESKANRGAGFSAFAAFQGGERVPMSHRAASRSYRI
jgi:hypothetical protein